MTGYWRKEQHRYDQQPNDVLCSFTSRVSTWGRVVKKIFGIDEAPLTKLDRTQESQVVQHFEKNYYRNNEGRFVVPLPKKPDAKTIRESQSHAVRQLLSRELALQYEGEFHVICHDT